MRKFLAIVAVLAILFAMAVPAFASGSNTNGDAQTPGDKSPQTGFDATAWTVAMGGLLLVAGVCFVCAGKKVTE